MQNSGSYSIAQFQSRMIRYLDRPSPWLGIWWFLLVLAPVLYCTIHTTVGCVWDPGSKKPVLTLPFPSRWAKLRINMLPATICEPISECFVASLIIGWAAHHVFRWDIMVFFMCHCLAWFVADYIQLRGVQVKDPHTSPHTLDYIGACDLYYKT